MFYSRAFFSIFSILSICTQAHAAAGIPDELSPVQERAWPDWFTGSLDQNSSQVSSSIFQALDQVILVSTSTYGLSEKLKIGRVVYDNHDSAQTYSVVDHIEMDLQLPVFSGSVGALGGSVFWGLGASAGLLITDVRQTRDGSLSSQAESFPQLQERSRNWYANRATPAASPTPAADPDSGGLWDSLPAWKALRMAQYSDFWNILSFPIRLPLKAEGLDKLEDGEIISFNASGALELSIGIGWSPGLPTLNLLAPAGASFTTFLNGDYEIAILKEDSRYAQVKVSRLFGVGDGFSIGAIPQATILTGFILKSSQIQLSIVPFGFSVTRSAAKSFDVAYRYDMNDPAARAAYEQAVLGRFNASEALSRSNPDSVQRVFSETDNETGKTSSDELSLSFLFSTEQKTDVDINDATLTFTNGTSHVLTAVADDQNDQSALWGSSEDYNYKYTVFFDKDGYAKGKDGSFRMMAEGFIKNFSTQADDLRHYMNQVETVIGTPGIFPRPPVNAPVSSSHQDGVIKNVLSFVKSKLLGLGVSSFYYRLTLTQAQTFKFVQTPEAGIWQILERAYGAPAGTWAGFWSRVGYAITDLPGIPGLISASSFANRWNALKAMKAPSKQAEGISGLFSDRWFCFEQMKALRISLEDEKIGYVVSGNNRTMGYVWTENSVLANGEVFDKMIRDQYFTQPWKESEVDAQAKVDGVAVSSTDVTKLEVQFKLGFAPQYLYFRILDTATSNDPTLVELVLNNSTGEFVSGSNDLLIDLAHGQQDQAILQKLHPGEQYVLSLAVSDDGSNWGDRSDTLFTFQ